MRSAAMNQRLRRLMFKKGEFTLHSGQKSDFLIDCEALTDEDLEALAHIGHKLVGPFSTVLAIPRGGLRFGKAMEAYRGEKGPPLIVDDVLTTAKSMYSHYTKNCKGLVIFSRGLTPRWVKAIFTMEPQSHTEAHTDQKQESR